MNKNYSLRTVKVRIKRKNLLVPKLIKKIKFNIWNKIKKKKVKNNFIFARRVYNYVLRKQKKKRRKKLLKISLIIWNKKTSNYYLTLTDFFGNVIFSISSGSINNSGKKKVKISPILIYPMLNRLLKVLRKHKLRNFIFVFKSPINKHVYNMFNFFRFKKYLNYRFISFWFLKPTPHHLGQRKKKPRRI